MLIRNVEKHILNCVKQSLKQGFTPIHPPNPARQSTNNFHPKFVDTSLKPNSNFRLTLNKHFEGGEKTACNFRLDHFIDDELIFVYIKMVILKLSIGGWMGNCLNGCYMDYSQRVIVMFMKCCFTIL
jgi:hypothetical protein